MVMAKNKLIEDRPEIVQAFVNASIEGWRSYIFGDPTPGNALILEANPDMTQDILDQASDQMRARAMLVPEDGTAENIGAMNEARWQAFFTIMSDNGVYPRELNWRAAFTTRFIGGE